MKQTGTGNGLKKVQHFSLTFVFRKGSKSSRKQNVEISVLFKKVRPNKLYFRHELFWSCRNIIKYRHWVFWIQSRGTASLVMGEPLPQGTQGTLTQLATEQWWGNRFPREPWPNSLLDGKNPKASLVAETSEIPRHVSGLGICSKISAVQRLTLKYMLKQIRVLSRAGRVTPSPPPYFCEIGIPKVVHIEVLRYLQKLNSLCL